MQIAHLSLARQSIFQMFSKYIQLHHTDNFAVLLITGTQTFYSFATMFTVCELCQQVNFAFEECNEIIEQLEWYSFPADIQRMLPSIINFVQQPIELKCFGSTACNRETFKYVSACGGRDQY